MMMSNIEKNLLRTRHVVASRREKTVIINQQQMINFAGNDYLNLAQDSRVRDAFIDGVNEFGFGSGSSPLVSGYTRSHQELEEYFAAVRGHERALFFNSGYHANIGVVTSFADRTTPVIADKHCHASIIDAITLSRAKHYRFHHHDMQHAETLLQQHTSAILITESVFSMSGAITATKQMAELANKYHALLMIDDAHGFGILENPLHINDNHICVTPFGKTIAGMGAAVSGSHDMIEYLLQKARTYCYSTALPPAVCAAALQSLKIIEQEQWRVVRLRELIDFFHREAVARNLSLISTDMTPIKCILTGSNQETLALQTKLQAHGIFVAAIRPPTVPKNAARIRISLNIAHTEADITQLLDLLL